MSKEEKKEEEEEEEDAAAVHQRAAAVKDAIRNASLHAPSSVRRKGRPSPLATVDDDDTYMHREHDPENEQPLDDLFVYYGLAPGQVPCENCTEVVACWECQDCHEQYCDECYRGLHEPSPMQDHTRTRMTVPSGSLPSSPKKLYLYETI